LGAVLSLHIAELQPPLFILNCTKALTLFSLSLLVLGIPNRRRTIALCRL
jgi:hypothetical protein